MSSSNRAVEVVLRPTNHTPCRTSARQPQFQGRFQVKTSHRLQQLETTSPGIQCIESTVWSFFNRSICFLSECPSRALLQLETGPSSSSGVDSLSQPWSKLHPYAFPLFALIGRCLQKVWDEKLDYLLLIALVWPAQSWYPLLLEMLVEILRVLPQQSDILLNPQGELHPLVVQSHLTLAACWCQGIPQDKWSFRRHSKNILYVLEGRHSKII